MKNKTFKNIRICCYVALAFCVIWTISMMFTLCVDMFGNRASSHPIDWSIHTCKKIIVLACYVGGTATMTLLCFKVVINIMNGLQESIAFPRSNEKLLFLIAMADFVRLFGHANVVTLWDDDLVLALVPENIITPFFLLFFAFMYKVAADAVEENNLTV